MKSLNVNEVTQTLIESYAKRELRNLGDVIIVGFDDAQYILSLAAVEPTYETTGRKTGYVATGAMFLTKWTSSDYYNPRLGIHFDDTHDLDRLCKRIIAEIDTQQFETLRRLFN